jgi:restriction system protein
MAIPDYQTIMLPLLRLAADRREHTKRELEAQLAAHFGLTESERATLLPSGRQRLFDNRVGWARTYLKQAGLLEAVRRGVIRITERGAGLLSRNLQQIDNDLLDEFPEFTEFKSRTRPRSAQEEVETPEPTDAIRAVDQTLTPDEQIRNGYRALRANLASELLDRVLKASPGFFERLVVELLVAMGYGGTEEDAASVVGRSGDGGIDGIIKEDRLGLDNIYLQAKRWAPHHTVGSPEVRQFAGALQEHRARKGVFITTSTFSREAVESARASQTTIVLINGAELAQLMLEFGVGVSVEDTIRLLKVDEDYFEEEM